MAVPSGRRPASVAFGLNRLDLRSPALFAKDAQRLESLGWRYGFIPSSPLLVQDPYVLLAHALEATDDILLGPLDREPGDAPSSRDRRFHRHGGSAPPRANAARHGRRRHRGAADGQASRLGGGVGARRCDDPRAEPRRAGSRGGSAAGAPEPRRGRARMDRRARPENAADGRPRGRRRVHPRWRRPPEPPLGRGGPCAPASATPDGPLARCESAASSTPCSATTPIE